MRTALVLAGALVACASGRKSLGELVVAPVHEQVPSVQVIHDATFRIEKGRILASGAGAGALDLVAIEDGCLRGSYRVQPLQICPGSAAPDNKHMVFWHSTGPNVLGFGTELQDNGDKVLVTANGIDAVIPLPPGPVGDELRLHPEFVGAAFALGFIPPSADSRDRWEYTAQAR